MAAMFIGSNRLKFRFLTDSHRFHSASCPLLVILGDPSDEGSHQLRASPVTPATNSTAIRCQCHNVHTLSLQQRACHRGCSDWGPGMGGQARPGGCSRTTPRPLACLGPVPASSAHPLEELGQNSSVGGFTGENHPRSTLCATVERLSEKWAWPARSSARCRRDPPAPRSRRRSCRLWSARPPALPLALETAS